MILLQRFGLGVNPGSAPCFNGSLWSGYGPKQIILWRSEYQTTDLETNFCDRTSL